MLIFFLADVISLEDNYQQRSFPRRGGKQGRTLQQSHFPGRTGPFLLAHPEDLKG